MNCKDKGMKLKELEVILNKQDQDQQAIFYELDRL
jgi:hypothetical protein